MPYSTTLSIKNKKNPEKKNLRRSKIWGGGSTVCMTEVKDSMVFFKASLTKNRKFTLFGSILISNQTTQKLPPQMSKIKGGGGGGGGGKVSRPHFGNVKKKKLFTMVEGLAMTIRHPFPFLGNQGKTSCHRINISQT